MTVPAGWYPDPHDPQLLRWWNGSAWTAHTTPATPDSSEPTSGLEGQHRELPEELDAARAELRRLQGAIVETRELMLLQEVGLYDYTHPLEDSVEYREKIASLRQQIKATAKRGAAVTATKKWAINGSTKEGTKMVADFGKLLLRTYNIEAEVAVKSIKPFALGAAIKRLEQTRDTVAKLGQSMSIAITDEYHALRVLELELSADYKSKVEEERQREREERARLREEAAARKEFEREQARLEKERSHYQNALQALIAKGDKAAIQKVETKLGEINDALEGVLNRSANIRAGYVYVISNIGAFGPRVLKIGMTRRLEPLDRVRELGGASVPFRFDVHALIFSDDAVGLEQLLHRKFEDRRLNLVNLRREYFYVTPREVERALVELRGSLLTFVEEPEALEWRQSEHVRKAHGSHSMG